MNKAAPEKEFEFTDDDFKFIVKRVNEKTGIQLAEHKRDMIYGRLARRLRDLNLKSFREYCEFLDSAQGDEEVGNFVNAVTTNLTSFFREGHHFEHLKEILKEMNAKPQAQKKLRIWSAASSSGPEPYSIAMTVHEALSNIKAWDVKILATDIDTNMLEKCKKGEYEKRILDDIPDDYQNKYVNMTGNDRGVMDSKLKDMIRFNHLNLLERWPMKGKFDIIFCRNVVIYFDKETQIKLFSRIADLMDSGGILYIGHSESLFKVCDKFELIGRTIYKKI